MIDMSELLQGFGVFLGVVAGVFVTLGVQWANIRFKRTKHIERLAFEFSFNVKKLDGWIDELTKYRNAINGDTLSTYYGYFDLSRAIYPTANELFQNGTLFDLLSTDDIAKLQVIASELSVSGETNLNNKIKQHKTNFNKQEAVTHVDFGSGSSKSIRPPSNRSKVDFHYRAG